MILPSFRTRLICAFLMTLGACSSSSDPTPATSSPSNHEGEACSTQAQCGTGACVAGACRVACSTAAECTDGVCLLEGTIGGCRLTTEATCTTKGAPCENTSLTCAVDGSCRTPCDDQNPCGTNRVCIAGACVANDEPDADTTWFSCTELLAKGTSGRYCVQTKMISCNESSAGATLLDTCDTLETCIAYLVGGTCTPVCKPKETRCTGEKLEMCKSDLSGFETKATCANTGLCASSKIDCDQGNPCVCREPTCIAGDTRCNQGAFEVCRDDLDGYETTHCTAPTAQCDPGAKSCTSLDIDTYEVTRLAYAQFLQNMVTTPSLPTGCSFKTDSSSFTPGSDWPANLPDFSQIDHGGHPVVYVDWCDALAYCTSKGRQLCGKIGGGAVAPGDVADPGKSVWMNVCSSAGDYGFPYGDVVDGAACNGLENAVNGLVDTGTMLGCHSPVAGYATPMDLSGNAAEWEDSCDVDASSPSASGNDICRVRGGSYLSGGDALRCDAIETQARNARLVDVGIRCCGL